MSPPWTVHLNTAPLYGARTAAASPAAATPNLAGGPVSDPRAAADLVGFLDGRLGSPAAGDPACGRWFKDEVGRRARGAGAAPRPRASPARR